MGFYNLSKKEREKLIQKMKSEIENDIINGNCQVFKKYASDNDTYIRKNAYLIVGRLYRREQNLREIILNFLKSLYQEEDQKVKETVIYTLGEIGKEEADDVLELFEEALNDKSLIKKNSITGALKQMGAANPKPTIEFAKKFLKNPDAKIRQAVLHGIELRGRTFPEDILPILKELQNDPSKNVIKKLIHVLSQISYKKGCLEKVVAELKTWENKELVEKTLIEILEVHTRYPFSAKSYDETKEYIEQEFKSKI